MIPSWPDSESERPIDVLTFFVRSALRGTTQKPFIPIGTYGTFTPDQARNKAKEYLQRLDSRENPHPKAQPKFETITIQDLYRQYISGKKTPLAASSVYQYDSWMNNHFKDWLTKPANTITGSMVLGRLALGGRSEAENVLYSEAL